MVAQLLGVDWGTTHRRAYLVGPGGELLRSHSDADGALTARGRFAESLAALRQTMGVTNGVPSVLSGMVGSANGWQEVPYLDCSVALTKLPRTVAPVREGPPGCWLVPGYRYLAGEDVDVMRGEETQLLGALALGHGDGWYVLPGTHCKWAHLHDGRVQRLASYLTGELFGLLRSSGTLSSLMAGGQVDDAALLAGARRAAQRPALSNALFGARARVVAGLAPAAQTYSYVSGLLIGAEFAAAAGTALPQVVRLLGAPELCEPYARIAASLGVASEIIDPQRAYCAALGRFMEEL